ncbi:MAG: Clp1/GlmU family protein [Candidatus Bathyarchaeota archaeon]|nr:Clp1/GlmU family protein [Candidatus Bathyarchaeota archaeon]
MIKNFEQGKTLLIDGPACVNVTSGVVEVFGYHIKNRQALVREGKRLPFYLLDKAELTISLGTNAGVQEVPGNTIPSSWSETAQMLLNMEKKPTIILVVGKIDSGKSSLCTYLVNQLVVSKRCVAVLDGDIGQSDIGPPGTLGYALTAKPTTELYALKPEGAFFVGVTSPIKAVNETLNGYRKLQEEILKKNPEFIVINTDGWVCGEEAIKYKLSLIEQINPDLIVGVKIESELESLFSKINDKPIKIIETPINVKERNPEKRKKLREKSYSKYLKNDKVRLLYMNQYKIENGITLSKKEAHKGLLLGFKSKLGKFLGIGILMEINKRKKALKVFTPVETVIGTITVGKVHFDKQLEC